MPHLVYDGLDRTRPLRRAFARNVVRAVLERKYPDYCPADYVDTVVASFRDDPVQVRAYRYVKPEAARTALESRSQEQVAVVINDRHQIHHVNERGYVESPVRISSIWNELEKSGLFVRVSPRPFPKRHITAVHDADFVGYLERACRDVPEGKSLYPYVFPIRNKTRPPKEPSVLAGYYCIDTFTPIHRNAFPAARRGVDCALTAAREILDGRRLAYALVRPPGHHAERRSFGGFCYFNQCAVAAEYLSAHGRVAILDIDYHHGNGQQEIFLRRSDVLTVSIHGHPKFAYPYFSGFSEENGEGEGEGFNLNLPLPEKVDGKRYIRMLDRALKRIATFRPHFLILALGLDTAKGDPTGTWSLLVRDFERNGSRIGKLGLPTLVVQEGGYRSRSLGKYARSFFDGLVKASFQGQERLRVPASSLHGLSSREIAAPEDADRVRRLVEVTGFFSPEEVALAEELVKEALDKGDDSGYRFLFCEQYGRLVGYACFGPVPCTTASYDVYWIAVHPDVQRKGVGRLLLEKVEQRVKDAGGTRIYVDTSQRVQYASTRAFYESIGYRLEGVMTDFYAPGEGKAVYCKVLL